MKIKVSCISEASTLKADAKNNEDFFGMIKNKYYWVIDGAGITRLNHFGVGSDFRWFVREISSNIEYQLSKNQNLISVHKAIKMSIKHTVKEYKNILLKKSVSLEKSQFTSACITLCEFKNDNINIYTLGDTVAILEDVESNVIEVYDARVDEFDKITNKRVSEIKTEFPEIDNNKVREMVEPIFKKQLQMKNKKIDTMC